MLNICIMADFQNLSNYPLIHTEPHMVVDEVSANEFYVGTSTDFKMTNKSFWKIKRIWKIGTIWNIGYPNGDQKPVYIWDNRTGYSYL